MGVAERMSVVGPVKLDAAQFLQIFAEAEYWSVKEAKAEGVIWLEAGKTKKDAVSYEGPTCLEIGRQAFTLFRAEAYQLFLSKQSDQRETTVRGI
jgi:hypothetical protein